uniref:Putative microtubule associated complex n=1 Tax=Corethrella appendiculata TaxID=1370023 RepID=U5ERU9_9DIPT
MTGVESVKKVANYMKVNPGKLSYNFENIVTRQVPKTNESVVGYSAILQMLAKESKNELITNGLKDIETRCQISQWIDYSVQFAEPASKDKHVHHTLLRELNSYLETRSYLVNQSLTLADLAVFYAIQESMLLLQISDKENYLNLSRWFNHIQQTKAIRQDDSLINFSTLTLIGWATGTHI